MKVVIVDYGMGNLRSVYNKVKNQTHEVTISADRKTVSEADKLILPGVGHFGQGMNNLRERGLLPILQEKVIAKKTPILGICLGMQLFSRSSEEGNTSGLGWIDAKTLKFKTDLPIRVPHMGWNTLDVVKQNSITKNIPDQEQYYFCHSYYFECTHAEDIVTRTAYGKDFTSAVQRNNIYGVQFHPEKSHDWGARMISDFLDAA